MAKINIKNWLMGHEGLRRFPYLDSTEHISIGYGRNLDDKGISAEEAEIMLENDISECHRKLSTFIWYLKQPEDVKAALINMCFNLGLNGLLSFKRMIKALDLNNYDLAADEALDSKWASQVGERGREIAKKFRDAAKCE